MRLLMDNCFAHGSLASHAQLQNFLVQFLPANTTSKVQLLDARIIASIKFRYIRLQIERAVELGDIGKSEIYTVDILTAMRWLVGMEEWNYVENNC